jgi:sulfatase modifying factor 1
MKQLSLTISAAALLALASGCGPTGNGGQLVGVPNMMAYRSPQPVGMSFVPSGVLKMGTSDEDITGKNETLIRTAQISGFYMDATEISNMEYRQFTNWVRDSIAHTLLGDFIENANDGSQMVNMRRPVNYRNPDVQEQISTLYIPAEQSGWGRTEFDNSKLVYTMSYFDIDEHAKNPTRPRTDYVVTKYIPAYPDTNVWMRQFSYSYNEPIARQYNWFNAFDNYPVVGVNWWQATAFCNWRTKLWRSERERTRQYFESEFRLPSESEWEWAARGGRNEAPYPWGGPYIVNKKGCYLANFKPQRGNYAADGGLYTTPVTAYFTNDYGLYNMAGNVAEWTNTSYFNNAAPAGADVNPDVRYKIQENDAPWMRRKVVRGGSWRDVAYYLQNGTRDYEFADTAKAYIGFRCIYPESSQAITNRRAARR